MSTSWIQSLSSFDPILWGAPLVFGNTNPIPDEKIYKTYQDLCLKKNLQTPKTSLEVNSFIQTLEKTQAEALHVMGDFQADHQILLSRSNPGKILIGIKERNPLKETENYQIHSCLLQDPKEIDPPQKTTLKIIYKKQQQTILKEINFLRSLSASPFLGIETPLFKSISYGNHMIGYAITDSLKQDYAQYMQCVETLPFQTYLTHMQQLVYGLLFLQHNKILHGNIRESHILIEKNRVTLSHFEELRFTEKEENPDADSYPLDITPLEDLQKLASFNKSDPEERKKAIQVALGIDRYQLGSVFNNAYKKWGFANSSLQGFLFKMIDPAENQRPPLRKVLEKTETLVSSYFSAPLQKSYTEIIAKINSAPIPMQSMFYLMEAALQLEPETFAILKYKENRSNHSFMIAKSFDNQIQIGFIDKKLGEGKYGSVHSSVFLGKDASEKIAIKTALDTEVISNIEAEIEILNYLHRTRDEIPGIQPKLLSKSTKQTLQIDPSFFLNEAPGYAMELFECAYDAFIKKINASLPEPVTENSIRNLLKTGPSSLAHILSHFFQLSQGLEFLQQEKVIHSDLTSQNILIKNGQVKIADFGSAINTAQGGNPNPETCPYGITPTKSYLEIYSKNLENPREREEAIQIALSIDRYQLGDLFYRTLNWVASGYRYIDTAPYKHEKFMANNDKSDIRKYPQHFLPTFHAEDRTENTPLDFCSTITLPSELTNFIKQMVAVNEEKRPSMEQVVKSFKEFAPI